MKPWNVHLDCDGENVTITGSIPATKLRAAAIAAADVLPSMATPFDGVGQFVPAQPVGPLGFMPPPSPVAVGLQAAIVATTLARLIARVREDGGDVAKLTAALDAARELAGEAFGGCVPRVAA